MIQNLIAPEQANLREKLEQNEKETAQVLAAASSLNQEYENERKDKERLKHEYEKEFAHMKKQINALE